MGQLAQVNILGQLTHPNIIRLLGCCSQKHEHLLVYEYMPNKSFDHFLFTDGPDVAGPLSWGTRLLIMIGVARGLTYLHLAKLIHRDLKSSNILLDEVRILSLFIIDGGFNAKIGDLGLAKYDYAYDDETHVSTGITGTHGYMAPEYYQACMLLYF
ncbi:putative protein kinase RLK-Pelle-RLCK-VIIa-2 family [Helianthus annuus]|nr:putative protein kinase RLK-Pelle-RLCK-VIIa-2 family [Helianthus annuus]